MSAAAAKAPRTPSAKAAVLAAGNQPNLPQFSKEEELLAWREMLLIRASRRRPASFTAWA